MNLNNKLNKTTALVVPLVILVLYTLALLVFPKTSTVIVCYVFGLLSAILFGAGNLCFVQSKTGYPWVVSIPMTIGRYVVTVALVSLLFSLASSLIPQYGLSPVIPAIVHIIVLAFYFVTLLLLHTGTQYIDQVDVQAAQDTSFMRSLKVELSDLRRKATPDTAKEMQKLVDLVQYSDPVSRAMVASLEQEIAQNVGKLRGAIADNQMGVVTELCTLLIDQVQERANKIRALK
jgi:hypothetical protein